MGVCRSWRPERQVYPWGDEFIRTATGWPTRIKGIFLMMMRVQDGRTGIGPVAQFAPNAYGLDDSPATSGSG